MTIRSLTIKLKNSIPTISRRLQVPDQMNMHQLHLLIQTVMPWNNRHYYEFEVRDEYWRECKDEFIPDEEPPYNRVAARWTFAQFLNHTNVKQFRYLYDFSIHWIHEIRVGAIIQPKPNEIYPKLIKADKICPPDDLIGGIAPYNDFREIIKKPKHRDYDEAWVWFPKDFDPDADVFPDLEQNVAEFAKKISKKSSLT